MVDFISLFVDLLEQVVVLPHLIDLILLYLALLSLVLSRYAHSSTIGCVLPSLAFVLVKVEIVMFVLRHDYLRVLLPRVHLRDDLLALLIAWTSVVLNIASKGIR